MYLRMVNFSTIGQFYYIDDIPVLGYLTKRPPRPVNVIILMRIFIRIANEYDFELCTNIIYD